MQGERVTASEVLRMRNGGTLRVQKNPIYVHRSRVGGNQVVEYSDHEGRRVVIDMFELAQVRRHLVEDFIRARLARMWPDIDERRLFELPPGGRSPVWSNFAGQPLEPPPPTSLSREELRALPFDEWLQRATDEIERAQSRGR